MKNLPVFITLISMAFSSCIGPAVYIPVTTTRQQKNPYYILPSPNAPLIENKGDFTGSLNTFFTSNRFDIDFFMAYEPAKHFGIMASYTNQNQDVNQNNSEYYGSWHNRRGEIGAGYNLSISKLWMAECYAGIGVGTTSNDHATGRSTLKQTYYFLQPAVGFHNAKQTSELGLVLRLNGMKVNSANVSFNPTEEPYTNSQFEMIGAKPMNWMIEPGIIYRFGWPNVKLQLSASYSSNLSNSSLESKPFHFSWGCIFKINTDKKMTSK